MLPRELPAEHECLCGVGRFRQAGCGVESSVGREVPICSALSLSLLRPDLDTGASLGLFSARKA